MNERLLQYIWQFQYFNKQALLLENGDALQIVHPGYHNTNQGPDFLEAKVRIEGTTWAGHVELHIKTSDWQRHAHQLDPNYNNVVLHVVWEHDDPNIAAHIPVLCLQPRVAGLLLHQYAAWMNNPSFIACSNQARDVPRLVWAAWKERLLAERLQRKTALVFDFLQSNNYHWEEVCWWLLARNFGITVNAEAFEAIAKTLPITILAKHRSQIHQLEALLFGQAGLLNEAFEEKYPRLLQKEYLHLQKKYGLVPVKGSIHYLRMRPGNFPTIRLAQLAQLIHQAGHLFACLKDAGEVKDLVQLLTVTANDFWHYHYTLSEVSVYQPKTLGREMVQTIIINGVVPLVFAWGVMHNDDHYRDKAVQWLEGMAAEKNGIKQGFTRLGVNSKDAYDSQALLELKSQYCDKKRCLDCAVGNALLKGCAEGMRVAK